MCRAHCFPPDEEKWSAIYEERPQEQCKIHAYNTTTTSSSIHAYMNATCTHLLLHKLNTSNCPKNFEPMSPIILDISRSCPSQHPLSMNVPTSSLLPYRFVSHYIILASYFSSKQYRRYHFPFRANRLLSRAKTFGTLNCTYSRSSSSWLFCCISRRSSSFRSSSRSPLLRPL